MKKISVILCCALFYALSIGCKKSESDNRFCASCIIKTTMTVSDSSMDPITNETTMDQCDLSQAAYDELLQGGNITSTTTSGDIVTTTKMTTTCTKK